MHNGKPSQSIKDNSISSPISAMRLQSDGKSNTGTAIQSDKNMMVEIVQKYSNDCDGVNLLNIEQGKSFDTTKAAPR